MISNSIAPKDECLYKPNDLYDTLIKYNKIAIEESCTHICKPDPIVDGVESYVFLDSNCVRSWPSTFGNCSKFESNSLIILSKRNYTVRVSNPRYITFRLVSLKPDFLKFRRRPKSQPISVIEWVDYPLVIVNYYKKGGRVNYDSTELEVKRIQTDEFIRSPISIEIDVWDQQDLSGVPNKQQGNLIVSIPPRGFELEKFMNGRINPKEKSKPGTTEENRENSRRNGVEMEKLPPEIRNQAILFLFDIGRWAAAELKERWMLARKKKVEEYDQIDLSGTDESSKNQLEIFLKDLSLDIGESEVEGAMKLILRKRKILDEFREMKLDNIEEWNRQQITRSAFRLRQEELDIEISKIIHEIEADLKKIDVELLKDDMN